MSSNRVDQDVRSQLQECCSCLMKIADSLSSTASQSPATQSPAAVSMSPAAIVPATVSPAAIVPATVSPAAIVPATVPAPTSTAIPNVFSAPTCFQMTPLPAPGRSREAVQEHLTSTLPAASGDSRVFAEHRSLFRNPLSSRRHVGRVTRRQQQHPYRINMWSHKFFCLPNVSTTRMTLTKSFKDTIQSLGLGEKVITLRCDASPDDLHREILKNYPLLHPCGGYLLLKCTGSNKSLQVIETPPGGHSPLTLSDVGQSKIYVRPLQCDIQLQRAEVQAPQEKCFKCNSMFGLDVLKDHVKTCINHTFYDDNDDDFEPIQRFRAPASGRSGPSGSGASGSGPSGSGASGSGPHESLYGPLGSQPSVDDEYIEVSSSSSESESAVKTPQVTKIEESMLLEMFPGKVDRISGYIQAGLNAHEIVDWLTDICDDVAEGFASILKEHASKFIDFDDDYVINTNRSCVWNSAQTFYKKALRDNKLLTKNLVIRFSGEEGVDAGALRNEFFEKVLQVINDNYFEGRQTKRLPKCHLGMEVEFEIIGLAIGHSLISGGPGFRCIHPAIVRFLLAEEPGTHLELPSIDDIPRNAQTEALLLLIDELNKAIDEDQLDELLDMPTSMSIINASNWPPTTPITITTKHQLLQHLVLYEVSEKRRGAMTYISKGLSQFRLLPVIKQNPSVLTYTENTLSAKELSDLILSDSKEDGALNMRSHEFFMEYLKARELSPTDASRPSLNDILSFWTGLKEVPPMGFQNGLVVKYLPCSKKFELPRSHACFETINLPVVHDNQQSFNIYMNRGILESLGHFGLV